MFLNGAQRLQRCGVAASVTAMDYELIAQNNAKPLAFEKALTHLALPACFHELLTLDKRILIVKPLCLFQYIHLYIIPSQQARRHVPASLLQVFQVALFQFPMCLRPNPLYLVFLNRRPASTATHAFL